MNKGNKVYIFEEMFRLTFPRTIKKSLFTASLVHEQFTYDVTVINSGPGSKGFYSKKPIDNEIWVYNQNNSRTLLISCLLSSIDFGQYYMTKMVYKNRIQDLSVSYNGRIKSRTTAEFEAKFGDFQNMKSLNMEEMNLLPL